MRPFTITFSGRPKLLPLTLSGVAVATLMAAAIAADLVGWSWVWLLVPLAPVLTIAAFCVVLCAMLVVVFLEGMVATLIGYDPNAPPDPDRDYEAPP